MRKRLSEFEDNLGRVSEDTRAALGQREAELRRLEEEGRAEREASRADLARKEAALRRLRADRKADQEAHRKGAALVVVVVVGSGAFDDADVVSCGVVWCLRLGNVGWVSSERMGVMWRGRHGRGGEG